MYENKIKLLVYDWVVFKFFFTIENGQPYYGFFARIPVRNVNESS